MPSLPSGNGVKMNNLSQGNDSILWLYLFLPLLTLGRVLPEEIMTAAAYRKVSESIEIERAQRAQMKTIRGDL